MTFSPHPIRVGLVHTAAELNLNLKVEVTNIASVWLHAELPADLVALADLDLLIQVEYGLLPVGVPDNSDENPLLWSQSLTNFDIFRGTIAQKYLENKIYFLRA